MKPKKPTPQGATAAIDIVPVLFDLFKQAGAKQIKTLPTKNSNDVLLTFIVKKRPKTVPVDIAAIAQAEKPQEYLQEFVTKALAL